MKSKLTLRKNDKRPAVKVSYGKIDPEAEQIARALKTEKALNELDGARSETGFFSFSGRATRGDYWVMTFISGMAGGISCAVLSMLVSIELAINISYIIVLIMCVPVLVRRSHDLNISGVFVAVLMITSLLASLVIDSGAIALGLFLWVIGAIMGFIGFILFAFIPGTVGTNKYGNDPLGRRSRADIESLKLQIAESKLQAMEKKKDAAEGQMASVKQKLEMLASMKTDGIISDSEYEEKRRQILDSVFKPADSTSSEPKPAKSNQRSGARMQKIPAIDLGDQSSPGKNL